jgi:ribonuclease P protein component
VHQRRTNGGLIIYGEVLKKLSGTTPGNRRRGMTPELSFPKKKRLVSNKQFKATLARKLRVSDGPLTLHIAENDCGYARLGVSVSKSCGGAVVRNRVKRLLREAFRQNQDQIPAGFDYLLTASADWPKNKNMAVGAGQLTFEQVKASFLALVAAAESRIKVKKQ